MLVVRLAEACVGADLGCSSKYSNERYVLLTPSKGDKALKIEEEKVS